MFGNGNTVHAAVLLPPLFVLDAVCPWLLLAVGSEPFDRKTP